MTKVVPKRDARQGRSKLNVLYVMLASLALMGVGWLVTELWVQEPGVDRQAISPEVVAPANDG